MLVSSWLFVRCVAGLEWADEVHGGPVPGSLLGSAAAPSGNPFGRCYSRTCNSKLEKWHVRFLTHVCRFVVKLGGCGRYIAVVSCRQLQLH